MENNNWNKEKLESLRAQPCFEKVETALDLQRESIRNYMDENGLDGKRFRESISFFKNGQELARLMMAEDVEWDEKTFAGIISLLLPANSEKEKKALLALLVRSYYGEDAPSNLMDMKLEELEERASDAVFQTARGELKKAAAQQPEEQPIPLDKITVPAINPSALCAAYYCSNPLLAPTAIGFLSALLCGICEALKAIRVEIEKTGADYLCAGDHRIFLRNAARYIIMAICVGAMLLLYAEGTLGFIALAFNEGVTCTEILCSVGEGALAFAKLCVKPGIFAAALEILGVQVELGQNDPRIAAPPEQVQQLRYRNDNNA